MTLWEWRRWSERGQVVLIIGKPEAARFPAASTHVSVETVR